MKRKIDYYEDVDKGDVIVRKRPYVFQAEYISKRNPEWQKAHPDGSYMRELYLGQGNNCLFPITLEDAKKRLEEWDVKLDDKNIEIESNIYREIVKLTIIGNKIAELLPKGDGYSFSKAVLQLCYRWIQAEEIDISNLYDCLDSPEEIDFTYYECIAEDEEQKKIYRNLFHIIAYITKRLSQVYGINQPQYLDYIHDGFFEKLMSDLENEYSCVRDINKDK